jgi:hypothetical protein
LLALADKKAQEMGIPDTEATVANLEVRL